MTLDAFGQPLLEWIANDWKAFRARRRNLRKVLIGEPDPSPEATKERVEAYRRDPRCCLSREQIEADVKAPGDII